MEWCTIESPFSGHRLQGMFASLMLWWLDPRLDQIGLCSHMVDSSAGASITTNIS